MLIDGESAAPVDHDVDAFTAVEDLDLLKEVTVEKILVDGDDVDVVVDIAHRGLGFVHKGGIEGPRQGLLDVDGIGLQRLRDLLCVDCHCPSSLFPIDRQIRTPMMPTPPPTMSPRTMPATAPPPVG